MKTVLMRIVAALVLSVSFDTKADCPSAPTDDSANLWPSLESMKEGHCWDQKNNEALEEIAKQVSTDRSAYVGASWKAVVRQLDALLAAAHGTDLQPTVGAIQRRASLASKLLDEARSGQIVGDQAGYSSWEIKQGELAPIADATGGYLEHEIPLRAALLSACEAESANADGRCPETAQQSEALMSAIMLATSVANVYRIDVITKLEAEATAANDAWDRFLFKGKPMLPLDIIATDLLTDYGDVSKGFVLPPKKQYFFMHPSPGFEYVNGANDGEQLKANAYVEIFGFNYWEDTFWKFSGVSLIVNYTDRAGVVDTGVGALFTVENIYSFAITSHGGDVGITINLDLANFYKEHVRENLKDYL